MNHDLDYLRQLDPYSLNRHEKAEAIIPILNSLNKLYMESNPAYRYLTEIVIGKIKRTEFISEKIEELSFVPVRLFKTMEMKISNAKSSLEMTSSGTSSSSKARIFIDADTSMRQSIALGNIVSSFVGKERLPFLVLDTDTVLANRQEIPARAAGILGFSRFSKSRTFALKNNLELDIESVKTFFETYRNSKFLVFGFTSIVWEKVIKVLIASQITIDPNQGVLFHGGGWKRVNEISQVSKETFSKTCREILGVSEVHDYYGMAEQAGSIFVECETGFLHCSIFSDIIIRDFISLEPVSIGTEGLIQVISVLPTSYPGHSILTEDVGVQIGEDDCSCSRLGKYFIVRGRVPKSEIRGCSDATVF